MIIEKPSLASRWHTLSLMQQLAHIGTDVDRAIRWRKNGDTESAQKIFENALRFIDYTVADPKNRTHRRREILRMREALVDYFMYDNEYGSSDELWSNYFYYFCYAAAREKGR
jgi:hypothetical protein